jgi:hypothetical protein
MLHGAKSLGDAKLKLENAVPKEAKTLPGIIATHEAERRRLLCKRTTMRKMFAVIDIAHFRQIGMAVFRNDLGYDGPAVVRPAASLPAAL